MTPRARAARERLEEADPSTPVTFADMPEEFREKVRLVERAWLAYEMYGADSDRAWRDAARNALAAHVAHLLRVTREEAIRGNT